MSVSHTDLNVSFSFKYLFKSIVKIIFQSVFRLKIHINNIFLFFKIYFLTSTHKKDLKT